MGLEKAIAHGKEHRKSYRDNDSRAFDMECRNQKLKEYYSNDGQNFSNDNLPVILSYKKFIILF